MPLKPTASLLSEAVAAADAIRTSATALAVATTVSVDQLGRELNTLQARFEVVAPLLALGEIEGGQAEVQAAAASLYGVRAPGDVLGLITTARAAGAGVVAAILGLTGTSPATRTWSEPAGRMLDVNLAGTDLAPLAAPLAALIDALEPIGG